LRQVSTCTGRAVGTIDDHEARTATICEIDRGKTKERKRERERERERKREREKEKKRKRN